jgi:uncharacterized iron-regulated membrane protein
MARLRLRALSRNIHLWLGLVLFLVLAPLGVTGSLLVFDDSLDTLLHPARYAVTGPATLTPGAYLGAARTAFGPRAAPIQLRMPQDPKAPVTVIGQAPGDGPRPAQLTAWIDPATGRVLDVANPRSELRGMVHQLHGNLFMAQAGRRLVGGLGMAMLISSITGLIIWWPRGNPLKGLRWRRSPSSLSNIHHLAGFWVCVPLAILSFTGAAIAFPDLVRAAQGKPAAPPRQPPSAAAPLAAPQLTADQALASALAAAGGPARLQQMTLPTQGGRPAWRVLLRADGPPVQMRVDDASGKAKAQPAQPQGPGGGDPVMRLMRSLHDGGGTGAVWQAIIVLTGLAPALLGVTGTLLWLVRRKPAQQISN